jgi:hypothetical protein
VTVRHLEGTMNDPDLFLPDPEPREVKATIISVDDHRGRADPTPSRTECHPKLAARAPRIVETPEGHQVWEFEGDVHYTQVGMNAVAGRRPRDRSISSRFRFDQMRPGCYDVDAQSPRHGPELGYGPRSTSRQQITGFCGSVFFMAENHDLGMACIRAWNDWLFEEWHVPYPERIVPLGITYLAEPRSCRLEIRRNADRGFTIGHLPRASPR